MLRFTILSVTLLILFTGSAWTDDFSGSYNWPLKLKKQFSSGFGDTRPGRFHMGVDVRTGGEEGAKVFAPEDGYIFRIKTSYGGYGKGLYLRGKSGRLYVFGHLQRYNWDIGTYLQERQIASERYYQDLYLDKTEMPVKKGDFIARTGQTGAGAPHLHFEIRNEDGHPINPLYFPVKFSDKTAPSFDAIWINYTDDKSIFNDGDRGKILYPKRVNKSRKFVIKDTVTVTGQFTLQAAISDYLAKGSFTLGPSRVELYIDDTLYHEVHYDKISYDENIYSILDKDLDPIKKENYKRVYNLHRKQGNLFSRYTAGVGGDGSFTASTNGLHNVLVKATDAFDNTSTLEFTFYYVVNPNFLTPFNKAVFSDTLLEFPLLSADERPEFDSVVVSHPGSDTLPVVVFPVIEISDSRVLLRGNFSQWTNYQLTFYHQGFVYPPYLFSTSSSSPVGQKAVQSQSLEIISGGILVTAYSADPSINWLMAEIETETGNKDVFFSKTGDTKFTLFYPPDYSQETVRSIITRGPVGYRPDTLNLDIHTVKSGEVSTVHLRSGLDLVFDASDLFSNALLQVRDTIMESPASGEFVMGPYVLNPEAYDFASWAELQSTISRVSCPEKSGLYVFSEKKGWLWAGGEYDSATGILRSKLGGTGIIAVISDTTAPRILNLNIAERGRVKISHPAVTFNLEDELSNIEDDRSFNVTIDNKWISPEYDPERKAFKSKSHRRLAAGWHELQIEVTDRCGNTISLVRKFRVGAKPGP